MSVEMWEKILTQDALEFMITSHPDVSEDLVTMQKFIDYLMINVNYKAIVVMATQWKGLTDVKQANLAIVTVGEYHASRFILLLDYLSEKFVRGELK